MESTDASPLLCGCMHFGGAWDDAPLKPAARTNTQDCVQAALDGGITFFDHADIYCLGKSEEAFGYIWSELGIVRDSIILQTKCGIRRAGDPDPGSPHRFDFSYDHITTSVRKSLDRLKTDYIDIFLLHRADPLMESDTVARAFSDLRNEGLVWQFGVSNFNASQIELLQASLPESLVVNQVEFNLLHSSLLDEGVTFNNPDQRGTFLGDGTLEYCRLKDITVQAYSPIAGGRVTPAAPDADSYYQTIAEHLRTLAEMKSVSPEAIMAAWVLRHPAGIRPVIGTTKPERIRAIAQARDVKLSREEWYSLYLAGRGNDIP